MNTDQSVHYYNQLLELRLEKNDQARGYRFEQLIREMLPWSYRPPVALSKKYEQLDAFFEWNGWHFLVESKAKKKKITAGSSDWEDFLLKIKRRNGQCVGLFCSLFPVSASIVEDASKMNEAGCPTIIICGRVWDSLTEEKISLSEYLRYMVLHVKANYEPIPKNVPDVRKWCYDLKANKELITSKLRTVSSAFLRRHKLSRHEQIYVHRSIDDQLSRHMRLLKPSNLAIH